MFESPIGLWRWRSCALGAIAVVGLASPPTVADTCHVDCPACATPSAEPICSSNLVDITNGGCFGVQPPRFESIFWRFNLRNGGKLGRTLPGG